MKERIEYIIEKGDNNKEIYVGCSVNYSVVAQASTLPKLEEKMTMMINMWLDYGVKTMESVDPLELKEISKEEWESEYKEHLNTSKWMHIADGLYDTIRELVGDKWSNHSTEKYEENTLRKAITERIKFG